jgi:hypothetical protein
MSRKTKLARPIAIVLGVASLPFATSAFAESARDNDWGYWSANNDTAPQAATHLKRDNGSAAYGYSPAGVHAHKKVQAR